MNDIYAQLILGLLAILLTLTIWNLIERQSIYEDLDEKITLMQAIITDIDEDVHELSDELIK
ncbi:MAG: hypothetical protein GDA50_03815 [Alphaproteobacteria bacterium GM202ARS2]|nr:hypothetical protein [Alphaproteobacteria bacterium GM202ARS2]